MRPLEDFILLCQVFIQPQLISLVGRNDANSQDEDGIDYS